MDKIIEVENNKYKLIKDNKKVNKINNYQNVYKYLSENCANDCKYFIVEKVK